MPLPILQPGRDMSADDVVRLFHRCELQWTRHLAEERETSAAAGTVFINADLPLIADANRVLDAALPDTAAPADVLVAEVTALYSRAGTTRPAWVPNPSAAPHLTVPLVAALQRAGLDRLASDVYLLTGAPAVAVPAVDGVTIIPARASFRHARALAAEAAADAGEPHAAEQWAEAEVLHLDDSHYDALLGIHGGSVVAGAGVLAVGEVGQARPPFVSPAFRGRGIERLLMARALETCARSLHRHVLLGAPPSDAAGARLAADFGFTRVGEFLQYRVPVSSVRPPAGATT